MQSNGTPCLCGCGLIPKQGVHLRGHQLRYKHHRTGGRPKQSLAERFGSKVAIVEGSTTCHEWTGFRNREGYGRITVDGAGSRIIQATHAALMLIDVEVPKGTPVFHTCDNPPCVRADDVGAYVVDGVAYPRYGHLWLGGHRSSNNRDMWEKGRSNWQTGPRRPTFGEHSPTARLNDVIVIEMRRRHKYGEPAELLAVEYGISRSAAYRAISGATWSHLPLP